jgi:hypothetical protein
MKISEKAQLISLPNVRDVKSLTFPSVQNGITPRTLYRNERREPTGHDVAWMYRHRRNGDLSCIKPALQLVRPEHVREFRVRCVEHPPTVPSTIFPCKTGSKALTIYVQLWPPRAREVVVERFEAIVTRVWHPAV